MNHKKGVEILVCIGILILLGVVSHYADIYAAHYIDDHLDRNSEGIIKGYEPYYLDNGNKVGVLVLHGFGASPESMRPLADDLSSQGYTVYVPLMAGHGTTAFDLESTSWEEWQSGAEESLNYLMNRTDKVYVIGYSTGGILALDLAAKYKLEGVVSFAAPIKFLAKGVNLLPLVSVIQPYYLKTVFSRPEVKQRIQEGYNVPILPVKAVMQLVEFIDVAQIRMYGIDEPVLVIQSKSDGLVDPISAELIYEHLSSSNKKVVWINNSSHFFVSDDEAEVVEREIDYFLKNSI
jgi:carboxylesterase